MIEAVNLKLTDIQTTLDSINAWIGTVTEAQAALDTITSEKEEAMSLISRAVTLLGFSTGIAGLSALTTGSGENPNTGDVGSTGEQYVSSGMADFTFQDSLMLNGTDKAEKYVTIPIEQLETLPQLLTDMEDLKVNQALMIQMHSALKAESQEIGQVLERAIPLISSIPRLEQSIDRVYRAVETLHATGRVGNPNR